ncbi:MAG TPA: AI-2E family transporter [Solirubrobacteraceae bacterium]|nr:AI-2E family transporter [Solirubrobacteraceae bacterium]
MAGQSQLSTRTIVRVFFTLVALGVLLYTLYLVRSVLGLLLIAVFLAVALGPAVDHAKRLRLPRGASILLVFVCLFLAIFLIGLIVVPPIVDEVQAFAEDVPNYIDDIRTNDTLREYDDKYDITAKLEDQASSLPSRLGDAAGALQAVTVGVFSTLLQLITVLTITFFLLLDGGRIVNFILAQVRTGHQDRMRKVAADIYGATGGYVAGALTLATAAGISTYILLSILNVPFAVPLAVLMAFFDLIPLVGSTIGGTLVALVTLFADFPADTLIWVAFVVVYQQVENSVLQPLVYRRTVNLHPLAVITAILIGSSLLGVLGALVAIPIAAAIQIALKDLWKHRPSSVVGASGDPIVTNAGEKPPREVELPPGSVAQPES